MNRRDVNEPPDNYVLAPLTISSYLLALIISFQQKKKKKVSEKSLLINTLLKDIWDAHNIHEKRKIFRVLTFILMEKLHIHLRN